MKLIKKYSASGNRTPVSRVTGGDTHHYTNVELTLHVCQTSKYMLPWSPVNLSVNNVLDLSRS